MMPVTGDINEEFGVYESMCCGEEIVIPARSRFPECPNHPMQRTEWKLTADEEGLDADQMPSKRTGKSAA
jgi:hypothetical protein